MKSLFGKKTLTSALIISLIAHIAFILFAPIEMPEPEQKETVLTTRIVAMPPPPSLKAPAPKTAVAPPPKPKPKPKREPPPPNAVVASLPSANVEPPPQPEPVPVAEPPPPAPPEVIEPVAQKKEEEEPPKLQSPEALPMPDPASIAFLSGVRSKLAETEAEKAKQKSKGEQQLDALPRLIDLNYKAAYAQGNAYPMPVGSMKLRFEHADGKYELRTNGQASGMFKLLYPGVLQMKSFGALTEKGLEPAEFEMSRVRDGQDPRKRRVVFDREAKLIRLNDKPPVPIEGPVFDVLTFIVQFYFAVPDSDEVTMQVVTPTRVDAYTLKRGAKEILNTPQGKIETEIWRGSRKAAAGEAEFWLAPSWHYIPFKVRMTDDQDRKASFDLESVAVEAKPKS